MRIFAVAALVTTFGLGACSPFGSEDGKEPAASAPTPPVPSVAAEPAAPAPPSSGLPQSAAPVQPGQPLTGPGGSGECESQMTEQDL